MAAKEKSATKKATAAKKTKASAPKKAASEPKKKVAMGKRLAPIVALPGVANAYGLTRAKGLGANAEAEALLGLGYPSCFVVVDEPFVAPANDAAFHKKYGETMRLPREAIDGAYAQRKSDFGDPSDLAAEVGRVMEYGSAHNVWLLEVMHGSDKVADAFVDAFTALPVTHWFGEGVIENYGGFVVRSLFFTLLRVTTAQRERLRARLEKTFDEVRAHAEKTGGGLWRPAQALDVILHGRAGVERSGRRGTFGASSGQLFLSELVYVDDDAAWVAARLAEQLPKLRPQERVRFDAQIGVAGGRAAMQALRASTERFAKHASNAEQVALFAA